MSKQQPPVPPDNRSPKGPQDTPGQDTSGKDPAPDLKDANRQRNPEQQGRQGNIKQNTTHQGYQQDR